MKLFIRSIITIALLLSANALLAASTEIIPGDTSDNSYIRSSNNADITPDGRFVAFNAWHVDENGNSTARAYVYDREDGTLEHVSVSSTGESGSFNKSNTYPSISDDGRFVTFFSNENLNFNPRFKKQVFVHDRVEGTTDIVSIANNGIPSYHDNSYHKISGDGRYVVFISRDMGLSYYPVGPVNNPNPIYVRDLRDNFTEYVLSYYPRNNVVISSDGRNIAYTSYERIYNKKDVTHLNVLYFLDRQTWETKRIVDNVGNFSMSADGSLLAFKSNNVGQVPNDNNDSWETYLYDSNTETITMVNEKYINSTIGEDYSIRLSPDGTHLVFTTVPKVSEGTTDPPASQIYLYEISTGDIEQISQAINGDTGDGASSHPDVSYGAEHIVFTSQATNLVDEPIFENGQVFLHTRDLSTEDPDSEPESVSELIEFMTSLDIEDNSIISLLENTADNIESGNVNAAINKLKAFINKVEAQAGKKIDAADAEALIDAADSIISAQ